jgi:hypothetical protein
MFISRVLDVSNFPTYNITEQCVHFDSQVARYGPPSGVAATNAQEARSANEMDRVMLDDNTQTYGLYIDGAEVGPSAGVFFPTEDPYTGKPWAQIARGDARDVDRAVAAAKAALDGEWSRLTPTARGKLMRKLADLLIAKADRIAEIERRDNGKLAAEVVAQVKYVGDYFHYYAGLADKIESHVIPTDKAGRVRLHQVRGQGGDRDHHALELSPHPDQLEAGAGPGGRLHGGDQAVGIHLGLDGRVRGPVRRGRLPAGRGQCGHRLWPGSRRTAGDPQGCRPHRLHRRRDGRPEDLRAGRQGPEDRDPGAGRQVAQHHLRRRRPRPGGQGRGLGHLRGHGPELPGRLAPAAARASTTPSSRS